MERTNGFFNLLSEINDFGAIKSPDFIAYIIPLLSQVNKLHEQNKVAAIAEIEQIDYTQFLELKTTGKDFIKNKKQLYKKIINKDVLEVSESLKEEVEVGSFEKKYSNLSIHKDLDKAITSPVYLLN